MRAALFRIGLDVGSTTAKIAVIDAHDKLIFSRYERHHAQVSQLINRYLHELSEQIGDVPVCMCVTGSVGMATAEQLGVEFAQEVVAAAVLSRNRYPQAKALIDIGGEDAKVVFFNGKHMELRMNGNCAGGTGAFIDQMSVLMGIDNQGMSELAMNATQTYPMAARCGVFAKTDIQNLMARNLPKENIAASIFHSIAVQTVVTLSRGMDFQPPILLCGGPLTFLPALRKAFADYLGMKEDDFIVSEQSNLIPALGCAIKAKDTKGTTTITALRQKLNTPLKTNWKSELPPLFNNEKEYQDWLKDKQDYQIPIKALQPGKRPVIIGVDSGSTTTKLVAIDAETGDIVFTNYRLNLGNPIGAVIGALTALKEEADHAKAILEILGSCATGYGEELIKTAFRMEKGIIETMAHYQPRQLSCPRYPSSWILADKT